MVVESAAHKQTTAGVVGVVKTEQPSDSYDSGFQFKSGP